MSIPKWIVLGWLTFSVVSLILNVGKPREPMTPQGVALATVVVAVMVWLVVIG